MTSITNENMPNSSLLNIKSEPELKKLDEEENIINTKMDIDENELIKGNITLINSDKGEILSRLQSLLESITIEKDKIENISSFICDKIYKYRNLILVDVFSLIFALNHAEPKVEYLCVINEILKNNFGLEQNEVFFEKISQIFKKIIFPYAKGILLDLNNSLIQLNQKNVTFFLNEWEKNNFFSNEFIKEIKFELKFWNEPNITGNEKDAKYLMNLVNFGAFKIEQNLIDFSRAMDTLNRNKDNIQRKNMLKLEKDLIQKQLKIYSTHLQQLKEIDLLLDKIKEHPELLVTEKNNN
jgi:hypothetical protein